MNFGTGPLNDLDSCCPAAVAERGLALTAQDLEGLDGVLLDAEIGKGHFTEVVGWGYMFGTWRFQPGTWVHTSAIKTGPDEDGIITTRSGSRYKLVMKAEAPDA